MDTPLFESIIDRISAQIDSGALRSRDRLPSVRTMSRDLGVSVTTVLRAYRQMEDRGLIEAHQRSGYFVRSRARLPEPPHTERIPLRAREVRTHVLVKRVLGANSDPQLVPLSAAAPSATWLPLVRLHRMTARALRHNALAAGMEIEPQGVESLRRSIARIMIDAGCRTPPDGILITNGCIEALSLALRAVATAGDSVIIESPVYYGIPMMLQRLGMKALEVPVSAEHGIDLETFEQLLNRETPAAAIVGANFQNPTGAVMSDADKRRLVELAARHRLPLIEDDLYGDLRHPDQPRPRALKAFDDADRVIYCNSFSKMLAPGYRIGWIAPGRWFEQVWQLKLTSSMGTAAPLQLGVTEFLEEGAYRHHVRQLSQRVHTSLQRAQDLIADEWPRLRMTRPSGGYLLWVELEGHVDALSVYSEALKKGIGVTPGPIFSATGRHRHHIRLNCGHPWTPRFEKGLRDLGTLIAEA